MPARSSAMSLKLNEVKLAERLELALHSTCGGIRVQGLLDIGEPERTSMPEYVEERPLEVAQVMLSGSRSHVAGRAETHHDVQNEIAHSLHVACTAVDALGHDCTTHVAEQCASHVE